MTLYFRSDDAVGKRPQVHVDQVREDSDRRGTGVDEAGLLFFILKKMFKFEYG